MGQNGAICRIDVGIWELRCQCVDGAILSFWRIGGIEHLFRVPRLMPRWSMETVCV
jgi:hypothetical protein